ncbi:hypothetical protein AEAE_0158 [Aeriscardovia aeriphila]|uniref:Uncharacterized protein n=1 Tax=Aeriscardovia aeriphila TaxID=218139 RepID=A0A261FCH9_9BIFI|nr:hypothetical protein AEAE_0158 [Aeriscardovia aeriphila]
MVLSFLPAHQPSQCCHELFDGAAYAGRGEVQAAVCGLVAGALLFFKSLLGFFVVGHFDRVSGGDHSREAGGQACGEVVAAHGDVGEHLAFTRNIRVVGQGEAVGVDHLLAELLSCFARFSADPILLFFQPGLVIFVLVVAVEAFDQLVSAHIFRFRIITALILLRSFILCVFVRCGFAWRACPCAFARILRRARATRGSVTVHCSFRVTLAQWLRSLALVELAYPLAFFGCAFRAFAVANCAVEQAACQLAAHIAMTLFHCSCSFSSLFNGMAGSTFGLGGARFGVKAVSSILKAVASWWEAVCCLIILLRMKLSPLLL